MQDPGQAGVRQPLSHHGRAALLGKWPQKSRHAFLRVLHSTCAEPRAWQDGTDRDWSQSKGHASKMLHLPVRVHCSWVGRPCRPTR